MGSHFLVGRIVNEDLMKIVRRLSCCICSSTGNVEAHHCYRRKPRIDRIDNLRPLCSVCHCAVHNSSSLFKTRCRMFGKDYEYWSKRLNRGFDYITKLTERKNIT